jgi:PAS domain S-box-containing protein
MAHGFCFLWEPRLVWLHVISDILTGIAYISLTIAMGYFMFKRRDLPFPYVFGIFALFILACGSTHLFAAYTVYVPFYWQEGYVKAFTALISITAVIMFIPMIPKALGLPSLPKAMDNIKSLNSELERQLEDLRIKDYALTSSVSGIVFFDVTEKLTYVNTSFMEMWGYESMEEVMGKSFIDLWQNERAALNVLESLKGGRNLTSELPAKKKNGQVFHVFFNANTIITSAGAPISYMCSFTDITDRRQAEEALLASEVKYRNLLEGVQLLAVMLDQDGNITFCNNYLLEVAGWTREDVLNRNWFELFLPEDEQKSVREIFDIGISEGKIPSHQENAIITREGTLRLIVWDNLVLRNFDGKITGVASIGTDVTDHRKLEEQLRHAQKLEGIGTLAGGIAHDFNNVLNAVVGFAGLLQMQMDKSDPLIHFADEIMDAGLRGSALTLQILAFSRKQMLDVKPVNLNVILNSLEKMLHRLVREDIGITLDLFKHDLPIVADASQIDQVLINLATNARDSMSDGGRFGISTEHFVMDSEFIEMQGYGSPGEYALLTVSDTGKGMDEETLKRIFEPFYTTKEVGKGTGLGLAVVHGIVKQHNGYIKVYSEVGKGTIFKIYLPLTGQSAEEMEEKPDDLIKGGTETILIAEDDASLRKLSKTVLSHYGYRVIEAFDGEDAVQKFAENRDSIKLLILDGIMPKKNGKEAFDEIRKLCPGIKTIFLSGYANDIFPLNGLSDKEAVFIQKPVTPRNLLRKVRETLDIGA